MANCYPEVKGAAESAVLWVVKQTEETLLSVRRTGGKRQKTNIYQLSKKSVNEKGASREKRLANGAGDR